MKKAIVLSVFIAFLSGGHSQPVLISGGPENDIIGRICRMPDGSLLAVVERNPDWNSGDLYSCYSEDNGQSWSALSPVISITGNQSTFSVTMTLDDSVRLYYASDETGLYRIRTLASADGLVWSGSYEIDLGWPSGSQVYDPAVITEPDGSMTMTYIAMGSGAHIAHCDEINAWDQLMIQIQEGAFRARVCFNPNGLYLASYHRNLGGNQYNVMVRTSEDLKQWSSETQITNNGNSHDPFCGVLPDGSFMVYYARYEAPAYNICRRESPDAIVWSDEEQITFDVTYNTQPAFIAETEGIGLVWTHAVNYDTNNDIYFCFYPFPPSSAPGVTQPSSGPALLCDPLSGQIVIQRNDAYCGSGQMALWSATGSCCGRFIIHEAQTRTSLPNLEKGIYLATWQIGEETGCSKILIP
ncbi:MAG: exo-alpha-sialidase [Bacteroidales bacterium]|nr:exo-alpha-sialidase [Bacteroidales bacterium]